jgi:hypothetical protein
MRRSVAHRSSWRAHDFPPERGNEPFMRACRSVKPGNRRRSLAFILRSLPCNRGWSVGPSGTRGGGWYPLAKRRLRLFLFGSLMGSVSQSEREEGVGLILISSQSNKLTIVPSGRIIYLPKQTRNPQLFSASTECWKHPAEANPAQRRYQCARLTPSIPHSIIEI